ncbi:hypothetical protein LY76DRAFT_211266 [Colletotrichum caudatum]|nr:hypothetical protein LY76DRAFT_211266 [Colletotrichum caudatum]
MQILFEPLGPWKKKKKEKNRKKKPKKRTLRTAAALQSIVKDERLNGDRMRSNSWWHTDPPRHFSHHYPKVAPTTSSSIWLRNRASDWHTRETWLDGYEGQAVPGQNTPTPPSGCQHDANRRHGHPSGSLPRAANMEGKEEGGGACGSWQSGHPRQGVPTLCVHGP